MSSATNFVNGALASNEVVIFSKSWCPFCKKAKALFAEEFPEVKPAIFELNERDDGSDIQEALVELTGQRTVPNIFIKNKHIGGNDDVHKAFATGELSKLLVRGNGQNL